MRYVIRADASLTIGAGHVMRTSAIAEELILRGDTVIFIGETSELDWVTHRIQGLGFSEIYSSADEFSTNKESDVLILDSYTLDTKDPFLNSLNWHAIVTLVDAVTPTYECNLKVHPGIATRLTKKSHVPILSGPDFIPLRKGIKKRSLNKSTESAPVNIVVTTGGTDPFGLVPALVGLLSESNLHFKVYLFTNLPKLGLLDSRFEIIPIGPKLDIVAEFVDLALTTASTSSFEFIARGIPVGIICAVDNQKANYEILGKLGVCLQLGSRDRDNSWNLDVSLINYLISSYKLRRDLSSKSDALIDLKGASRIVDEIKKL